jgi:hypothetical protein
MATFDISRTQSSGGASVYLLADARVPRHVACGRFVLAMHRRLSCPVHGVEIIHGGASMKRLAV